MVHSYSLDWREYYKLTADNCNDDEQVVCLIEFAYIIIQ